MMMCVMLLLLCTSALAGNNRSISDIDPRLPVVLSSTWTDFNDDFWLERRGRPLHFLLRMLNAVVGETSQRSSSVALGERLGKYQDKVASREPFPCTLNNTRSAQRPRSVHQLRPGDIDVVAAIGDSITAGAAISATNMLQILTTNRGLSWAIGGQGTWRQYLTLPNILKEFNPQLVGYALGDNFFSSGHRNQQLNMAESGATAADALTMATSLVKKMKKDSRINFQDDWKLVTVLLGAVDMCLDECYHKDLWQAPVRHRMHLARALDYLMQHSPRTLVNLVVMPDISASIPDIKGMSTTCKLSYRIMCPCIMATMFRERQKQYAKLTREVQHVQESLAEDLRYQTKEDFAVVKQPFFLEARYPLTRRNGFEKTDFRNLSPDCFHGSQRAHAMAANALWNNLLEPVGGKSRRWQEPFRTFRCPTAKHPFIFTNVNSEE